MYDMSLLVFFKQRLQIRISTAVCSTSNDVLLIAFGLKNIAMKGADCRCIILNMSRSDAINRLNNFKLDDR